MNGDLINTIVDKQAFKELEELKGNLLDVVDLIKTGSGASFKVNYPSDLKKQIEQTSTYQEKVTQSVEKTRLAEIKLQKAREKAFDDYEKKLRKEQEQREKQVKSESDLRQKLARQKEQQQKRELATIQSLERQKERNFQKEVTRENRKARQDAQQVENQKILARNAREYAVISSRLSTEYRKQSTILEQLKRKYKDAALLYGENSKEAKQYLRDVQQLDAKLKKVDANVGEFRRNVGNYSSAWGKVGNLMISAAAAFGVYSALDIGRQIYSQIKEINALNAALLQVTETQESFNQAQVFLYDLAERTGSEINTLQKGYTKFLASAKETNLTLEETQHIYETVATAGAVLGQSTEQVEGAMRALEQMLSKGKIQAEEVRGQLGERLPGAYQILAKSMGLTNQELDKQLELGQVISDEVLPGFAKELEKTFGLKQVEKVETLVAAQGRLSNDWRKFVESLSSSQGTISTTFRLIYSGMSKVVKLFQYINSTEFGRKKAAAYASTLDEIKNSAEEAGKAVKRLDSESDEAYQERVRQAKQLVAIRSVETFDDEVFKIKERIRVLKEEQKEIEKRNSLAGVASDSRSVKNKNEIELQTKRLAWYTGMLEAAEFAEMEYSKVKEDTNSVFDEGSDKVEQRAKVEEYLISTYQRSMAAMENYKKFLSEIQSKMATSSKEYAHIQTLIDKVTESMSKLDGSYDFAADIEIPEADALQNFLNNKIPAQAQRLSELLGTEQQDLLEEFLSLYEWDYNNWLRFQDMKLKAMDDYGGKFTDKQIEIIGNWISEAQLMFQALGDIAAGFSERRIQQIEREMEANDEMYDKILSNEKLSERQRIMAENNREKDRERLNKKKEKEQIKQAKMQKAQAALNVVLNTSMAIISALAQIPKFDFGISAGATAALYAATGAAQLAAVMAQPIPKYAKGKKASDSYEGPMIWGEKQPEVKVDRAGNVEIARKPTFGTTKKGDTIYPSIAAFENSPDFDAIMRATIFTSMANQHENLSAADLGNAFDYQLMMDMIDEGIKKGFDGVVINNTNHNDNSELLDALRFQTRRDV